MTPIRKDEYCIIRKNYTYLDIKFMKHSEECYFVAEVLKSNRAGVVQLYKLNKFTSARDRVDYDTVFSVENQIRAKELFLCQDIGFRGYTKEAIVQAFKLSTDCDL